MRRPAFVLAVTLLLALVTSPQSDTPTLFQKPTVNRTHIVFHYAGDLWIVPRDGGDARRLTTGVGIETDPVFSPDGSTIAFTGEYDGNVDVFTVPAAGGIPQRLTYHPGADRAVGWTRDSKQVLFRSARANPNNTNQLFTVSTTGGFPAPLPLPVAFEGAYSPDGTRLAYQPITQWQPAWKRYRGGQTGRIWIARLSDSSIEKVPRENSNDTNPMWIDNNVFFLSDRDGSTTLYRYDTSSKRISRAVPNGEFDIKSASAGPGVIAYEQFGSIFLYDIGAGRSRKVHIRITADQLSVRPRFERVSARFTNAQLSPTGVRAVFEARGEIITVPAEKGDWRNLTNSTSVMERDPAWSPDGKWIAYFSDESGEYALHLAEQSGRGEVKKISLGNPASFYFAPTWSPDSKKIAFTDAALNAWYVDIEKGPAVKVDTDYSRSIFGGGLRPAWSPDSRWLAYTKQLPNFLRAVFLYSLATGKSHQVTDGMSDARYAAFDKSGKFLYFAASTDAGHTIAGGDLSAIFQQVTRSIYLVVLRADLPSPLAPESDEEKVAEQSKDERRSDASAPPAAAPPQAAGERPPAAPGKAPEKPKEPEPLKIDLDGIDQRIISLPIPQRNFVDLLPGKANILFLVDAPLPSPVPPVGPPGQTVQKYDLEKRKLDPVIAGIASFRVSHNGEKMLYRQGANWIIQGTAAPPRPGEGVLGVTTVEVRVDPPAEWPQMYREAWRHQRHFYYDPGYHGLDLKAAEERYRPYLQAVAHRGDLTYLFTEMLNQLTVGHMFIGGGDAPQPNRVPGGLLGADFEVANGRYRFARIYRGENWNPQLRAPLTEPGVNVKQGEYLLAVNGRDVRGTDNVYSFFESTANKQVVLRVGPNPDARDARNVTVVPVASESALRYRAWIDSNRRKVDELSGGRLAYIHMPDTANGGYVSFNRYFFAQTNKDGAIVDERYNSGGLLAEYIVSYLTRPLLSFIAQRHGADHRTPQGAIIGPKVMLINESAGSGGDAMPWFFRTAKVGPLIGTRTWGGLVGVAGTPALMDGGGVASPSAALYGLSGDWEVENVGIPPDIEVEMDPAEWRKGRDPQLERGIQYLLDELKKNPPKQYKRPAYPNYHKR
jgi:tricorn protease